MNRLDFLGLNANEAACALLYVMAVVWVLNLAARRVYAKVGLITMEAVLVVLVARTMSRGAVVTLVCALACVWWVGKKGSTGISACASSQRLKLFDIRHRQKCLCYFFSYSPVWRLLLLLSSPGLWARSSPAYVAQDASIGNRFELWKGAVKLIATAPLRGWGYTHTGASYMNWFQGVNDHTYYNGLVNSYLQIGAAFGLPVLFGVLVVLFAVVFQAHGRVARATRTHGQDARATQTGGFAVHGLAARATLLCFLWILIWMLMSCFSSMFASPLLFVPPLVAVIVALFLHPPAKTEIIASLMISFSLCLLLFSLGHRFAGDDSLSITRDSGGMVTVANNEIKTGKTCVIFVDEGVLGEEFGKEVRKFMLAADFETCVVVDKVAQTFLTVPIFQDSKNGTDRNVCATLIILSGITVDQVEIKEGLAKYILLNPAFLPAYMPYGSIQAIVYPEINPRHYFEPEASSLEKFRSKIHKVPFDENFETSWASYIAFEIPNPEIPNPK